MVFSPEIEMFLTSMPLLASPLGLFNSYCLVVTYMLWMCSISSSRFSAIRLASGAETVAAATAGESSKQQVEQHMLKGKQLLQQGRIGDALTHFHAAIDLDADNYNAYFQRATVFQLLGRPQQAVNDLDRILELQSSFHMTRRKRSEILLKQGDFDRSFADLEVLVKTGDKAAAETAHQAMAELHNIRENYEEALMIADQGDCYAALPLLAQLIQQLPWCIKLRKVRADCNEYIADLPSAIADLRYAAQLETDATDLHLHLSRLFYRQGSLSESLNAVRECLRLDPDHAQCKPFYRTLKTKAKIYNDMEKAVETEDWPTCIDRAETLLRDAQIPDAVQTDARKKLCHCLAKEAPVQTQKALQACDKVLELDPGNIDAMLDKADIHLNENDADAAIEVLRHARDVDQHNQRVHEKLKQAERIQKTAQSRDYYAILGVSRNAKKRDIEKAYRKKAAKMHPDMFHTEAEKKKAEKVFHDLAAAKEVLTDDEKRQQFDSGVDPLSAEAQSGGGNPFGGGFGFPFGGQTFQQGGRTFTFRFG